MSRPDIILICTDQQRIDTIAAWGFPHMKTPNLDRLVGEGVSFRQACTPTPVCMSARWSMMTGQLPSTHGCLSNHHPGPPPNHSLPKLLKAGGYLTAMVGKNHTFMDSSYWDVFCEEPSALDASAQDIRKNWEKEQPNPRLGEGTAAGGPQGDHDVAKTDRALQILADEGEDPLFLFVSYLHPHTPYYCPDPFFSLYKEGEVPGPLHGPEKLKNKPRRHRFHRWNNEEVLPFDSQKVERMRRTYCGQVSLIDHELGRLREAIEARQRDTMIVFTTDHGDYQGDHGLFTKSPSLYDVLVRVPLVIHWPGRAPAGEERDQHVSHIDLLPSLLEAAGLTTPGDVEGQRWLPVLESPGAQWRNANALEYGIPGDPPVPDEPWKEEHLQARRQGRVPWEGNPYSLGGHMRGVRTSQGKLVWDEHGEHELYDLKADPLESTNLRGEPKAAALQTQMLELLQAFSSVQDGS